MNINPTYRAPIVVEPNGQTARCCVIWLHGLGANGHDFEGILPHLRLPEGHGIRFIFPHASDLAVTINGGVKMPAWYDITAISPERSFNEEQFTVSVQYVRSLVESQIASGIEASNILLAGFSQGGAVVYEAALQFDQTLAGLMALSTYMARPVAVHPSNQSIPILVGHGSQDNVVPEGLGMAAVTSLKSMGLKPTVNSYSMAHEVCLEEISDIASFIQRCFA